MNNQSWFHNSVQVSSVLYSTGGKHKAHGLNLALHLFYPAKHLVSTWKQH